MNEIKKIAFAGGSTGGHVMPLVSLIQWLQDSAKDQKIEYFRFGENHSLEKTQANMLSQVQFISISSGKLRRKPSFKEFIQNILDIFKFIWGIFQSLYFLSRFHIQLIFSKWGFVSLPVVIAGWLLRIPILVHESDSKPGISTRIASKFATKIFTGFENVLPNAEYTGQILSSELIPKIQNIQSDVSSTQILVNCGSLWSASVHTALLSLFAQYPELVKNFSWTVLLGKLNLDFKKEYEKYPEIRVVEFADQVLMGSLYLSNDVSICRAGSTSLVEQHIFGLKQIIVPIPWTHDQSKNAQYFASNYQDIIIDQQQVDWSSKLYQSIISLQSFKKNRPELSKISQQIQEGKQKIIQTILFTLTHK